ncbi:MAG: hypothetical protein CL906_01765 [Dehalococcoidia bacterium]|nr:hypothetical protein [Dehalococcoidia bacterium]
MKRSIYLIMLSLIISASLACAGETVTETIVEEKIVEVPVDREVIKEVEVEVEKVVTKEKIVEKIVPPPDYKPGNRGDVARDDTLIITGFGPGATQWEGFDNLNPYSLGGLGRVRGILNKTIYEYMYYYNHNTGEQIPWLATSYDTHADGMGVDVTLRDGIEWSDGVAFTCDDVKYTIELLRDTEELVFASDMNEWVKDVDCKDDHNFTINLNKPNVRFFYFYFVENSEIHIQILPKHVWEKEDPLEFNNWDPDKGYPVGTGPYVAVEASAQGQIFDRNDAWWASKVGFSHQPVPLRIAYIPPGSADTAAARTINNEFDVASIMQPGVFLAAKSKNPNVKSWAVEGPSWGAADACLYTLGLNTQWGAMSDVNVRRAINRTVDREKLVMLAYESSTVARGIPYSTYGGLLAYEQKQADLIAKYDPTKHDLAEAADHMALSGWTKDGDGMYTKDGAKFTFDLHVPGWLKPMGPVLEKQFKDGGFDTTFVLHDPDNAPMFDKVRTGNADAWVVVHCGSSNEPWGTLQHYHSKFAAPSQGEMNSYIWGNSHYNNPDYDAIIDQMDAVPGDPNSAEYMALADQALEYFLKDITEVTLAEERHVVTFNDTYWKGMMSANDPYVAPYSLWAAFIQVVLNVSKAQ